MKQKAKDLSKDVLIYQAFGKDATIEQKMLSREHLIEIIQSKVKKLSKRGA